MSKYPYNTQAWQKLRRQKLNVNPLCEVCLLSDITRSANVVDHIKSIASGGAAFPSLDGLKSMCASCHSVKTNAQDNPHSYANKRTRSIKGCKADGSPLDEDDAWYGGGHDITGNAAPKYRRRSHKKT